MTEAATWLVLSKCPNAPALMVGDTEQCKPVTQANQKDTAAVFGQQRGASLLERIVQLDHVDVWLTDNHRAKGNVQTPIAMPTAPPSTGLRRHIRAKHLKEMNKMPRMLDYFMSEKFQEALKALDISKAALDDEAAGNDPSPLTIWVNVANHLRQTRQTRQARRTTCILRTSPDHPTTVTEESWVDVFTQQDEAGEADKADGGHG